MKDLPLYKQIRNYIVEQIESGILRAGDRVPSEVELADLFHVSQITSKNALISLVDDGFVYRIQGKGTFVSENTLQIKNSSGSGKSVKQNNNKNLIGVIFPSFKTKVDYNLLYHLDKYIHKKGFNMVMHNCEENIQDESLTIQNFLEIGVEGLIIFPTLDEHYNESILRLSLDKYPLVLIDRYLKKIKTSSVCSDNLQGTFKAINHLISLGHRKIAYISPAITNSTTEDRAQGFEKAFLHNRLSINKNLWCIIDLEIIDSDDDYNYILNFLKKNNDVTAIFTVNSRMFNITYKALKELNKRVPEDIELFAFDEPDVPNISYILQDYKSICFNAVETLTTQINTTNFEPTQITIPVELIVKNTY